MPTELEHTYVRDNFDSPYILLIFMLVRKRRDFVK